MTNEEYRTVPLPCSICGDKPQVIDGRIKHPSCLEQLIINARSRMPAFPEFDVYLANIDKARTPNLPYEEAAALWPTVPILMWNALNDPNIEIRPA